MFTQDRLPPQLTICILSGMELVFQRDLRVMCGEIYTFNLQEMLRQIKFGTQGYYIIAFYDLDTK